ncbi:hypothetical protein QOZ80_7BG0590940 [Eleusine coracana subsp. coracana]|nr:hypothetical protein QOZ80_7BG0590940 [Eleusine coracana subsp. coracana]
MAALNTPISDVPHHRPAGAASKANDDNMLMLPIDIVHKIFQNIPARQLCRLRTVCKSWRSLLCDPAFVKVYDAQQKPLVVVVVTGGHHVKTVEFVMMDLCTGNVVKRVPAGWMGQDWSKMHVHHHLAAIALDQRCLRLRVVDLESGAVSVVPNKLQVEHPHDSRSKANCVALVVGRAATGEHKAFRVREDSMCNQQFCHIIDLEGDCDSNRHWRETQAPKIPIVNNPGNAAVVNGVAYFLVRPSRYGRLGFDGPDGMASFDLATEQWSPTHIHGPLSSGCCAGDDQDDMSKHTFSSSDSDQLQLAALNGRLVVGHVDASDDDNYVMDLWFYEGVCPDEDGGTLWRWTYSIQCTFIKPLWVLDEGKLAMSDRRREVRVYDPGCDESVDVVNMDSGVSVGVYTGGMLSNY